MAVAQPVYPLDGIINRYMFILTKMLQYKQYLFI